MITSVSIHHQLDIEITRWKNIKYGYMDIYYMDSKSMWKEWNQYTNTPNLFSVNICHMKMRLYLRNVYLVKENEEKHYVHT